MGAGRKPKPPSEKQSRVVSANLTPGEHAALKRAAGHESVARFVRRLILRSLTRRGK